VRSLKKRTDEARKDDALKSRVDLIPPAVLLALGEHYAKGARKYGPRDWEKGIKFGRIYAALCRHLFLWFLGADQDEDGFSHLDAVVWNAVALKFYSLHPERYGEFDDRPK
jgi:hypothetical protein